MGLWSQCLRLTRARGIALSRKSVVVCALFVFWSISNIILFQYDVYFSPYERCGSWCPGELSQHCPARNATIQPLTHTHPKLCFFVSRLMAPFNSCKLQFGSVKCNGRVGLPGCPWKIFSNICPYTVQNPYWTLTLRLHACRATHLGRSVWNYHHCASVKWNLYAPQAAREGHRWKQKRYVHNNALQMVLFMIRCKRVRTVASDLPTGSYPLPRLSSCLNADACKSFVA